MDNFIAHILVVDDDDGIRSLVKKYLNENNYLVTTANNAENASEKIKIIKFDLIILDMIMPKKNGFEVLTALQNDPKTAAIPVIILSNLGQAIDRQKGIDLGAADYLVKDSATLGVIINKINHILDQMKFTI